MNDDCYIMPMIETYDAVVALGGGIDASGRLPEKVYRRMNTAIALLQAGAAAHLIVSGRWSFLETGELPMTEAAAMQEYAISQGVPSKLITGEASARETIGNACFTKKDIVRPQGIESIRLVTSESHMGRSLDIFRHVYGDAYRITGEPAPERITLATKVWEKAGGLLLGHVLDGVPVGDEEAALRQLEAHVPGYGLATRLDLLKGAARGMAGLH